MSQKPKFNQIISVNGDIHHQSIMSPIDHRCVKRQKKVTFDNYALYLQFRATDCPSEVNITLQKHNQQTSISIST
ncbi:unnamed protein product [Paramecium pentaurelia]|uniref:Uncharacterized protein n=1 Tax=Paramecium pentaurelia TaxID=43138 RepID=A0A8S1XL05_9CILI|nr:unnamed protein product [Paramecium pentaurelia]